MWQSYDDYLEYIGDEETDDELTNEWLDKADREQSEID